MGSGLTVDRWRRLVFASKEKGMTGNVKVLCLYLADHMNRRDRKVRIPRAEIADALGCHEQRVAERFRSAVDAGYLQRVQAGYTGMTAVYQATQPDCVPETRTHTGGQIPVHSPNEAERESARLCTGFQDAIKGDPPQESTQERLGAEVSAVVTSSQDEDADQSHAHAHLLALFDSQDTCPHNVPLGFEPAPWDPMKATCSECRVDRSKSDRDRRTA